jgi:hypothetical protein
MTARLHALHPRADRRQDDVQLQPEDLLIIEALARDIVQAERLTADRERNGGKHGD